MVSLWCSWCHLEGDSQGHSALVLTPCRDYPLVNEISGLSVAPCITPTSPQGPRLKPNVGIWWLSRRATHSKPQGIIIYS